MLKNNNLKICKNNIAYSKNFDKIVFKIEKESYILIKKDNNIIFERDALEYNMKLVLGSIPSCTLYLKEINSSFDIKIIHSSYYYVTNKCIINYLLESDDEESQIEIEMETM